MGSPPATRGCTTQDVGPACGHTVFRPTGHSIGPYPAIELVTNNLRVNMARMTNLSDAAVASTILQVPLGHGRVDCCGLTTHNLEFVLLYG